jgi:hypothetical protein
VVTLPMVVMAVVMAVVVAAAVVVVDREAIACDRAWSPATLAS